VFEASRKAFEDSTTQCLLFSEIFVTPAVLQFDQQNGSRSGCSWSVSIMTTANLNQQHLLKYQL
jgi:hypothetical protein